MTKIKYIASLVIGVISIPLLLGYLTFSNSLDCSQLVVDTYEFHSSIDIPEVEFVNCYYDEASNTRISVYDLTEAIDLKQFKSVEDLSSNYLPGSKLLMDNEQPNGTNVLIASGEKRGTQWTYVVDQVESRLWASLNYSSTPVDRSE